MKINLFLTIKKSFNADLSLAKKILTIKPLAFLRYIIIISLTIISTTHSAYSWNALGHRLIMQIAYDHMSEKAKNTFTKYNNALDTFYRERTLINSAEWLDNLRYRGQVWLGTLHYIDIPFSVDGIPMPTSSNKENAVSAIYSAERVLKKNHVKPFDKGFASRILMHVVGDLHQPMHAASQYSARFLEGDHGGNRVHLGANDVAQNLHGYWDEGGGFLKRNTPMPSETLQKIAANIENQYPCHPATMNLNPKRWATESHDIAVKYAYQVSSGQIPTHKYQQMVQEIAQQRIAIAGCRLASLLNKMA